MKRWESQVKELQQSDSYRELFGIDGEPIEFEWHIFPGRTSLEIFQWIQKDLQDPNIEPQKFGDGTPACREYTHPRAGPNSRLFAANRERTIIEPVFQVRIVKFLGYYGIVIQVPSTTTKDKNSWVVVCREKNRSVQELPHREPRPNSTRKELLMERSFAKESEPVVQSWSNPASSKPMHDSQKFLRIQCTIRKKKYLLEKGSGMISLPADHSKENRCQPKSQNWSWLVRRYDQDEREIDDVVHWNSMCPKLRNAFLKYGSKEFSDTDWLQHVYHGSNKMGILYCVNSQNYFLYIRVIQGHTGGNLTASELMGHVVIP